MAGEAGAGDLRHDVGAEGTDFDQEGLCAELREDAGLLEVGVHVFGTRDPLWPTRKSRSAPSFACST